MRVDRMCGKTTLSPHHHHRTSQVYFNEKLPFRIRGNPFWKI